MLPLLVHSSAVSEGTRSALLAAQASSAEKRARAHFIVDTGGTLAETDAQVDNIVESLKGREGTAFATAWA